MKNNFMVSILIALVFLSACKTARRRSPRVVLMESVSVQAMKNFELGQKVIFEKVPRLAGQEFDSYTPHPFVKLTTGGVHTGANQAYSKNTNWENILHDINQDNTYFDYITKAQTQGRSVNSHVEVLKRKRVPYVNSYEQAVLNLELIGGKFFTPEVSFISPSFFHYFKGILDPQASKPTDEIARLDASLAVDTNYRAEGSYPEGTTRYLWVQNDDVDVLTIQSTAGGARFFFMFKERVDNNEDWFVEAPALQGQRSGVYIPYRGRPDDQESFKSLIIQSPEDLSKWTKKASASIFLPVLESLPDQFSLRHSVLGVTYENPVYYLETNGQLVRLTKQALQEHGDRWLAY